MLIYLYVVRHADFLVLSTVGSSLLRLFCSYASQTSGLKESIVKLYILAPFTRISNYGLELVVELVPA